MFIKNRTASLIYKIAIIVVSLVSLLLGSGIVSGTFQFPALFYYPVTSGLFCLIFYIVDAIYTAVQIQKTGNQGVVRFAPHFKGAVVMAMLMNIIVFFFILAYAYFNFTSFLTFFSTILSFFILPLLVLADWALFNKKGRFYGSDPVIWMMMPFIYYAFVLLAAQFDMQYFDGYFYPYPFLDPNRILWAPVLFNIILLTAIYLAVGFILMGVDRGLGNYAKKKAEEAAGALSGEAAAFTGDEVTINLEQDVPITKIDSGAQPEAENLNDMLTAAPVVAPAAATTPPPAAASAQPYQAPGANTVASPTQRPAAPAQPYRAPASTGGPISLDEPLSSPARPAAPQPGSAPGTSKPE